MKINSVYNINYNHNLSLSGPANKKSAVPFSVEKPISDNCNSYEYEKQYLDNVLKALNARKDELYSYLDTAKDGDGLTIPDKLLSMFDTENLRIEENTFLHKTVRENVESLQKNGFDPTKINQTNFGPGFYVGVSEGALSIYHGDKMQVKYKGNTAQGKNLSGYGNIKSEMVNKLTEYLEIKPDFSNRFIWKEFEAFGKFLNEYSRKTITEKFGIDGAWANGSDGYFVIFNPDAVKEIKHIN